MRDSYAPHDSLSLLKGGVQAPSKLLGGVAELSPQLESVEVKAELSISSAFTS